MQQVQSKRNKHVSLGSILKAGEVGMCLEEGARIGSGLDPYQGAYAFWNTTLCLGSLLSESLSASGPC